MRILQELLNPEFGHFLGFSLPFLDCGLQFPTWSPIPFVSYFENTALVV